MPKVLNAAVKSVPRKIRRIRQHRMVGDLHRPLRLPEVNPRHLQGMQPFAMLQCGLALSQQLPVCDDGLDGAFRVACNSSAHCSGVLNPGSGSIMASILAISPFVRMLPTTSSFLSRLLVRGAVSPMVMTDMHNFFQVAIRASPVEHTGYQKCVHAPSTWFFRCSPSGVLRAGRRSGVLD